MIRARFWVTSVESVWNGEATKVRLAPVYDNSEENKKFFQATPTGQIELYIRNDIAAQAFVLNQEYEVDFRMIRKSEMQNAPE